MSRRFLSHESDTPIMRPKPAIAQSLLIPAFQLASSSTPSSATPTSTTSPLLSSNDDPEQMHDPSDPTLSTLLYTLPLQTRTSLQALAAAYPTYNIPLLARFAAAKPSPPNSIVQVLAYFEAHVQWRRNGHEVVLDPLPYVPSEPSSFPKNWVDLGGTTIDGCTIMFCQGGAYDLTLAPVDVYVERCRHIIDRALYGPTTSGKTASGKRKLAVFIDCRAQKDLINSAATNMISYFKQLNVVVANNYPGLIQYMVLYTIPRLVLIAVVLIKKCISKEMAESIRILGGEGKKTPEELKELYIKDLHQLPAFSHKYHDDLYDKVDGIQLIEAAEE
jgi:hypothetical protein